MKHPAKQQIEALEAGLTDLLGMTLEEYAILQDEHPDQAEQVYRRALAQLEEDAYQ